MTMAAVLETKALASPSFDRSVRHWDVYRSQISTVPVTQAVLLGSFLLQQTLCTPQSRWHLAASFRFVVCNRFFHVHFYLCLRREVVARPPFLGIGPI
jgi:hypothetical protein